MNVNKQIVEKLSDAHYYLSKNYEFEIQKSSDSELARFEINNQNAQSLMKNLFETSCKKPLYSFLSIQDETTQLQNDFFAGKVKAKFASLSECKQKKTKIPYPDIIYIAYLKALRYTNSALEQLTKEPQNTMNKIINELGITNDGITEIFYAALLKKLNRIKQIVTDQDSIILLLKEKTKKNTQLDDKTLGITLVGDGLDRIFINTDIFNDDFNPDADLIQHKNKNYYISLIADTICHEAVHAVNSGEDLFYLPTNDKGEITSIDQSIKHIERILLSDTKFSKFFTYLCKIYFTQNPNYRDYNLESLIKPENLYHFFQYDNYFKSFLLLNNPDFLSLLIRRVSSYGLFNIE